MLSIASTLRSDESSSLGLQDFPLDSLPHLIRILVSGVLWCTDNHTSDVCRFCGCSPLGKSDMRFV